MQSTQFVLTHLGLMLTVYHEQMGVSWYCENCAVEVYDRRCPHCGKTKREKK